MKTTSLEDDVSMAFPRIGHSEESKKRFIKTVNADAYEELKGKDAIIIGDLESYKKYVGNKDCLWNSKYMKDPDANTLYKRAILHTIGNIFFDRVKDQTLIDRILQIDIKSKVYETEKKHHPAHPSYATYFLVAFPELMKDKTESAEKMKLASAGKQFSDIFALQLLGYISKDVEDRALAEKIKLVNEKLKPYKK